MEHCDPMQEPTGDSGGEVGLPSGPKVFLGRSPPLTYLGRSAMGSALGSATELAPLVIASGTSGRILVEPAR